MNSQRLVIAGASSLLGAEVKSLLEESRFAASDFRLVDEETVAGTITEAGGEAAVIQPVEEDTFQRATIIFFTGSTEFTRANFSAAQASGAKIIDLSGASLLDGKGAPWFLSSEKIGLPEIDKTTSSFGVPSAPAIASATLVGSLHALGANHSVFLAFQPVSEAGKRGIEELEQQTGQLLSFQSVGNPVFGTQVAFNLLDRFGEESSHKLAASRDRLRREVQACLNKKWIAPAVQLIHAPVFYGAAFSYQAELAEGTTSEKITQPLKEAGLLVSDAGSAPSNVSAAGETSIQLAPPEQDAVATNHWWFWGAADNIRLPAWNAVKLAERLLP